MSDIVRQEVMATACRIVVKVGTRVLTRDDGTLNEERIAMLAGNICDLTDEGREVILVSSGAVAAGMSHLSISQRPKDLAKLQAMAAVGQSALINVYEQSLLPRGRHAAQVLLTAADLHDRTRYLNVRNTLLSLLEFGTVPIINENDTVAVDELAMTFGDNDRLAGLVTNLMRASLLVILSDVDGLHDGDPANGNTRVIPLVDEIGDEIMGFVCDRTTGHSKGGMASKINAAKSVTAAGENVLFASGSEPNVLKRVVAGENLGTLFIAQGKTVSPRKRWIGFSAKPHGKLMLDEGASHAITAKGRSLLAIGIVAVEGGFKKGDIVSIRNMRNKEIARGLTNYAAEEIRRIQGLKSDLIEDILGHIRYEEVIHRDNLTLL